MKRHYRVRAILIVFLFLGSVVFAAEQKLPVVKGKKVVAMINGERITLEEFNQENAFLRMREKPTKEQNDELLRRLINTRLVIQEAKRTGLYELAEIKKRVEVFSRVTLREELMERHIKDLKPDEKEVDKLYKEYVKEWKMSSVLFEKEEAAKEMEKAAKEGKDFQELVTKFTTDGKAKESEIGKYFKNSELLPELRSAITKMKIGEMSSIIRLKGGFVIFRLEEVRFPDNEEAKALARKETLKRQQEESLKKYNEMLKKKYVKVNQKIFESIDYNVKGPEFQKLLKDQRILAQITGEKPITVGELTDFLRQQLYHGVERALESQRLKRKKTAALEEMLGKRVLLKEALRLGIDKTERYQRKVKEHEDSLVFEAFVKKAIVPDIKMKQAEVEDYYNEHIKEYTYPEMIRINSLAFLKRGDAERAVEQLRKGTDLQWLKSNAEGQVEKTAEGLLDFEGKMLMTKELPEDVQKALSGVRGGDIRLYGSPNGYSYVLAVQEVVPSKPKPFEEARQEVAMKVFNERLKKAIEDFADKLRALSDVKIYLKD